MLETAGIRYGSGWMSNVRPGGERLARDARAVMFASGSAGLEMESLRI